ncbi:MAG: hypothetical protein A2Z34_05405 [Planctomycetes bacterium RBG_16_59_8]|nr:MAG: hypothetical protein A2Z34_05405 [Planctomycetes bacterium RBG_16_59_8]
MIINADDFGMDSERNRGILSAAEEGLVTSVALLANGEGLKEHLPRLLDIPSISVGLHLNVTEGEPLVMPSRSPFFRGKEPFWDGLDGESVSGDDVRKEFRAQMNRFMALTGRLPSHVDGHQHIHVAAPLVSAVIDLCREYRIERIRVPFDPTGEDRWNRSSEAARTLFAAAGLRSPDHFRGTANAFRPSLDRFLNDLESIPEGASTEIMVHPGYRSVGGCAFSDERREEELAILRHPRVRAAFTAFECIRYDEL